MEPDLLDSYMLFSRVCTPGLLYTRSPTLGFKGEAPEKLFFGCLLANSFADPWYWIDRSIFHGIYPIKEKNCNMVVYGIVLYCKQSM